MEWFLSITAGLVVLRYTFHFFFDDWQELAECLKHWFTPEVISILRGEWDRSLWAELKIFAWLLLGILASYGSHQFLLD